MIDFHSHILPGIDDGSKSCEQSVAMLKTLASQGITKVIATPHFYPNQDINEFISNRQESYEKLMDFIREKEVGPIPEILLGAEVLVGAELANSSELHRLCIENTSYMLLEMPYGVWASWVHQVVDEIIARGMTPIMAHIERFEGIVGIDAINTLMQKEVLGQMNTYSLGAATTGKLCKKLIKHQMVHVIGSDVHRVRQLEQVAKGREVLLQHFGEGQLNQFEEYGKQVLANQTIARTQPKPIKKILGLYI